MITIGIDPDSKKHGIAIFRDISLIQLTNLHLLEVLNLIDDYINSGNDDITLAIEDVNANKFIYARNFNGTSTLKAQNAQSIRIGCVQQAQVELERAIEYKFKDKVNIAKIKPFGATKLAKRYKGNEFKLLTNYQKTSNEDNRSAYFIACHFLKIRSIKAKPPATKSKLFDK